MMMVMVIKKLGVKVMMIFSAMLMVWLFLKQPLAGVAQSPPHFLQTFLGEIKDRVSLLNIMIFFARQQTIANNSNIQREKDNKQIHETKKKQKNKDGFQPTARSSDRGPTAGVSGRAPSATVGKGSLFISC